MTDNQVIAQAQLHLIDAVAATRKAAQGAISIDTMWAQIEQSCGLLARLCEMTEENNFETRPESLPQA